MTDSAPITLVQHTIDVCTAESDLLGRVARQWFAPALRDDRADHPTTRELAAQLGIEAPLARRAVVRVRQLASEVAREAHRTRQHCAA